MGRSDDSYRWQADGENSWEGEGMGVCVGFWQRLTTGIIFLFFFVCFCSVVLDPPCLLVVCVSERSHKRFVLCLLFHTASVWLWWQGYSTVRGGATGALAPSETWLVPGIPHPYHILIQKYHLLIRGPSYAPHFPEFPLLWNLHELSRMYDWAAKMAILLRRPTPWPPHQSLQLWLIHTPHVHYTCSYDKEMIHSSRWLSIFPCSIGAYLMGRKVHPRPDVSLSQSVSLYTLYMTGRVWPR